MRRNEWHDLEGNKADTGILLQRPGVVQQERDVSLVGSQHCEYQCRGGGARTLYSALPTEAGAHGLAF